MFLELGLDELVGLAELVGVGELSGLAELLGVGELSGLAELVGVGELSGLVELLGVDVLSGLAEGFGGVDTFSKGLVWVGTGCAGLVSGFGVGTKYRTVAAIAKLITPAIAGTA